MMCYTDSRFTKRSFFQRWLFLKSVSGRQHFIFKPEYKHPCSSVKWIYFYTTVDRWQQNETGCYEMSQTLLISCTYLKKNKPTSNICINNKA